MFYRTARVIVNFTNKNNGCYITTALQVVRAMRETGDLAARDPGGDAALIVRTLDEMKAAGNSRGKLNEVQKKIRDVWKT